jgi:hypothetical protein
MGISSLAHEESVGVLGAVDGNLEELVDAIDFFHAEKISVIVQLGDFGWPKAVHGGSELDVVDRLLDDRSMLLFFVDGETDDPRRLGAIPVSGSGVRWLTSCIGHLPRGSRGHLVFDHSFAAMGGAGDPELSDQDEDQWTELRTVTGDDLEALEWGHTDVLFGHEAPLDVLALDRHLAEAPAPSASGEVSMRLGRSMFDQAVDQTTPQLVLSAHHRWFFDETVGRLDVPGFGYAARAVGLAPASGSGISRAILRTSTLALAYYNHAGNPIGVPKQVTDLLDIDGGRWRIDTQGSSHIVDLDRWTAERRPGPRSGRTMNDGEHRLRTFERCRIGRSGYWTLNTTDPDMEFSWHRTSVIRHIEKIPDE